MCLSALHLAAKEGHVDVIKELLLRNADPNQPTKVRHRSLGLVISGLFR